MQSSLFDLTGRVALITGSTKGIGREIAVQMAAHGADVVVSSRTSADCGAVANEINESQGREAAVSVPTDVLSEAGLERLVAESVNSLGQLDCLVCNAPVATEQPDMEAQRAALDGAVWSVFRLCRLALPHLKASDRASIVVISSIAGLNQPGGMVNPAYSLSKAALVKMTLDMATEWAGDGITVNAICPGLIRSATTREMFFDNPRVRESLRKVIPLGRGGYPEEVAGQAVLLASRAGAYITGQAIAINGGYMTCHPDEISKVWMEAVKQD